MSVLPRYLNCLIVFTVYIPVSSYNKSNLLGFVQCFAALFIHFGHSLMIIFDERRDFFLHFWGTFCDFKMLHNFFV